MWRAVGILVAAGGLRNAALLLRELKLPDAAAAFCAACKEAGFHSPFAPPDAGALSTAARVSFGLGSFWEGTPLCVISCRSAMPQKGSFIRLPLGLIYDAG